ncbi:MAG TPA: hypothetical protein VKB87_15220 [Myxococcaceae bacterium]|nr:hypothetical protein [Myxococcaceae bacterium]
MSRRILLLTGLFGWFGCGAGEGIKNPVPTSVSVRISDRLENDFDGVGCAGQMLDATWAPGAVAWLTLQWKRPECDRGTPGCSYYVENAFCAPVLQEVHSLNQGTWKVRPWSGPHLVALQAMQPGDGGVKIRGNGEDFSSVSLSVTQPDSLRVEHLFVWPPDPGAVSEVHMKVNQRIHLGVTLRHLGTQVCGALPLGVSQSPRVVRVEAAGMHPEDFATNSGMALTGLVPGDTTLQLSVGELRTDLKVSVSEL